MKKILPILTIVTALTLNVASAATPDADNSAINERDRSEKTMTPMDQSNDEADLAVVQTIRKALVAHETLSLNAKNVKVITNSTHVFLRGPVKSQQEKRIIDQLAKDNASGRKVENQLEIETQDK